MDLQALLEEGANVTITVTTAELKDAFLAWGKEVLKTVKPKQDDEWLTIKEAADLVKVSPWTIRNYIKRGWIEATKQGAVVRIRKSSIDNFDKL